MLGNGNGGVVAGTHQKAVQEGVQGELFSGFQVHGGPLGVCRIAADCHHVFQIAVPDSHQSRHNLGNAGNGEPLVRVFLVQDFPGCGVQQNSAGCGGIHRQGGDRQCAQEQSEGGKT